MEADLLRSVVAALDEAGIPHMVTGSIASAIHGQPRATRDIDVVIDPPAASVDIFVAAFPSDRFYVGDAHVAVIRRDMFNIIDVSTGWKADLIVRKERPFSREEFARRTPAIVAGVATWITTPEDAILSKLEWHSMSGSEVQRRDVLEMITVNVDRLDSSYLKRWAAELGLSDLLATLWAEANNDR